MKSITRFIIMFFLSYYLCYTTAEALGFEHGSMSRILYFIGAGYPFSLLVRKVLGWTFGDTVNAEMTPEVEERVKEVCVKSECKGTEYTCACQECEK